MRAIVGLFAAAAIAAGAACSDSTGGDSSGGGCRGAGGGAAGAVEVGNILFRSSRNGSCNPAVDTIPAGGTVTWTWTGTGSVSHSVRSQGTPSFTSSVIQAGNGITYMVQFNTPGTYRYDCAVHGSAMTGRVVVQ
ncbi:MAG TPA: cupredoxin domain-containing protein [Gemmatimonadales bacterium]|jgi:plastocyanin|nr:cupredoxin domain-containing protein [Gemmatimonadales bacterium]